MKFIEKITGDPNEKELKKIRPIVDQVNSLEPEAEKLSDAELKERSADLKARLEKDETTDDILAEAFALAREVARRTLGERHYDVQILGGIVLHHGKIAEMRTGEGKTLSSTAPIYLNALEGNGVHVITVNDYLAKRDAVWMGQIYHALGLSVGVIANQGASFMYDPKYAGDAEEDLDKERDALGSFKVEEEYLRPADRKEAYEADITYGTNNEFGFDYLRDNLVQDKEKKVQRGHPFAIVDEIDSILIDEARTPLIISAPDQGSTDLYKTFAGVVPKLKEEQDYTVDRKMKAVSITEEGIEKVEKSLGMTNIYDPAEGGGMRYVHNLEQALKAHILFIRDKNYVVREGEVIIVDEFTGRLMPGRRYSEGLHQAIEAKEGVNIQQESRTLASVTFQNYFRMYEKLSGMTGTAETSSEEFFRVYKLEVVVVPTNKPTVRNDMPDFVFKTEKGKYQALLRDIKERNEKGQPVLVGTTSIEKNEYLSKYLKKEGIKHELLNAKNHIREGEIIAQAGRKGAVTVATNMAGRGVDIVLGGNPPDTEQAAEVKELGGLHVVGTERHEARRIDNQLRGRAGRQGDPGSTQFYLSLEDDLVKVFGGDKIKNIMETFKVPEDQPLESKMVSNAVENAQQKIEGFHFDSRKHVLEYDEVLNKHRETIYKRRDAVLEAEDEELKEMVTNYLHPYLDKVLEAHIGEPYTEKWNIEELFGEVKNIVPAADSIKNEFEEIAKEKGDVEASRQKIKDRIFEIIDVEYKNREEKIGEEATRKAEKWLVLRTIDMLWMDHLDAMAYMRDDVRLRAYAQRDPLVEYKNEGLKMFHVLLNEIEGQVARSLFKVHVHAPQDALSNVSRKVAEKIRLGRGEVMNPAGQASGTTATSAPSGSGSNTTSSSETSRQGEGGEKIGRNDPCHCGSGKKFKKCHGQES